MPAPEPPAQGTLLGDGILPDRFRVRQQLGRGAYGHVLLAWDSLHERDVALKLLDLALADAGAGQGLSLNEARALARVRHPNVVTVYELVHKAEPPFLVMEYLEGEELELRLTPGSEPMAPAEALKTIRPVVTALVAAHEAGVLHRDIKPSNVMVGAGGRVTLIDFGIASRAAAGSATEAGSDGLMGTPYYLAPEVLAGEEGDARADLFAVGVTLFRMLTLCHPFEGRSLGALRAVHLRDEGPPALRELRPELPVPLAEVVRRCLLPWEERYASAAELLRELDALGQAGARPLPAHPYLGLRPFTAAESGVFFGREEEVARVVSRLRRAPVVTLVGASGVGKSSLALAGVAPAVQAGALSEEGGPAWRVAAMTPGRDPLARLISALSRALGCDEAKLAGVAEAPERWWSLLDRSTASRRRGADHCGLLLVVDQLEELVTVCQDPARRGQLGRAIQGAQRAGPEVRVLATVRDDFLARLGAVEGLHEALDTIHLVRPLDGEALRAAVVEPARAFGVSLESEEMSERIVQELAGRRGALPLLQFAMGQLWEARDQERRVIPLQALERMGGIGAALARAADEVYAALRTQGLGDEARLVLLELLTPDGTKRTRGLAQIVAAAPAASSTRVGKAAERLRAARLVLGGDDGLELAHEALATEWPPLRRWVEESRALRQAAADAQHAAARWSERGRPADLLWRGAALEEARTLLSGGQRLKETSATFLRASLEEATRRSRWRRLLVLGLLLGVAVAVAIYVRGLVRERDLARGQAAAEQRVARGRERVARAERQKAAAERDKARALSRWVAERKQLLADLRKARSEQLRSHILSELAAPPRRPPARRAAAPTGPGPASRPSAPRTTISVCVFGPADDLSMAGDWKRKTAPMSAALRAAGYPVGCEYPYVRRAHRFREAIRSGLLQHRADLPAAEVARLVALVRQSHPRLIVRSVPAARLFRKADLLLPE
jgi:eukaryotic-like serine/threonine-protein kinase